MSRHHRALNQRRWQAVRRRILNRAKWTCAKCGRFAKHCDHVIALEDGGEPYAESNLQPLCFICHQVKTAGENAARDPQYAPRAKWRALVNAL